MDDLPHPMHCDTIMRALHVGKTNNDCLILHLRERALDAELLDSTPEELLSLSAGIPDPELIHQENMKNASVTFVALMTFTSQNDACKSQVDVLFCLLLAFDSVQVTKSRKRHFHVFLM